MGLTVTTCLSYNWQSVILGETPFTRITFTWLTLSYNLAITWYLSSVIASICDCCIYDATSMCQLLKSLSRWWLWWSEELLTCGVYLPMPVERRYALLNFCARFVRAEGSRFVTFGPWIETWECTNSSTLDRNCLVFSLKCRVKRYSGVHGHAIGHVAW